jgi:hypothetical protein
MSKPLATLTIDVQITYSHLEPTEPRMIALFGQDKVDQIKQSNALVCYVKMPDKTYYVGYNGTKFYTASFLPDWLKGM